MRGLASLWQGDRRRMFQLAGPALLENLLATMVQFVDTAMVGALGAAATAAVAVNATPMWLFNGLVSAIGVGGTALVARHIGASEQREAEDAAGQVFLGILALSTVLCVAVFALAGMVPVWMRADPSLHADATAYLRILALSFIPHFTGMALGAVLRGAGDTRTPMRIAAATNVLNVIGNYFLIFSPHTVQVGALRIPVWGAGMGVRGAALSSAISMALGGLAMVYILLRRRSRLHVSLKGLRPNRRVLGRILHVGFPAALERLTINVGQLLYVGMIAAIGTAELAAHHLSITVESLSYMPGFAFGVAATTLVGQSLGARDPEAAMADGKLSIMMATLVMSAIGVLLYALAPVLIALLTPDEAVRAIGMQLIRICAFEQPFMALSMVSAAALRGAGDTRVPFLASLIGMWGVRLTLAWLFIVQLGWGVSGAWYAMVLDVAVRGILLWARFLRGRWVTARV